MKIGIRKQKGTIFFTIAEYSIDQINVKTQIVYDYILS